MYVHPYPVSPGRQEVTQNRHKRNSIVVADAVLTRIAQALPYFNTQSLCVEGKCKVKSVAITPPKSDIVIPNAVRNQVDREEVAF
jgi:hypothetical protein